MFVLLFTTPTTRRVFSSTSGFDVRGARRDRALGVVLVARLAPMLGGCVQQGTRHAFGSSSGSHAQGLGAIGHSV
jgi:hypothetical protein